MELYTKTLDIFFRRIPAEAVLNAIQGNKVDKVGFLKGCFLEMAEPVLSGYSYEEKCNIFEYSFEDDAQTMPPFGLLRRFTDHVLTDGYDYPMCRFDKIMLWRNTYLLLGQDLFTTAWSAGRPRQSRRPDSFAWPAILPTDNALINDITHELAENHMHLYAGASVFSLSWCCLMNHPDEILKTEWSSFLQPQQRRNANEPVWTTRRKMIYAAYLRALLFQKIQNPALNIKDEFTNFHSRYFYDARECTLIHQQVNRLRFLYGFGTQHPGSLKPVRLDYAFTDALSGDCENDYRLLAGERRLMYDCFQASFYGRFTPAEQWIYYLYLLFKSSLRSEMVQANAETGFHNFMLYDDRKKLLWKNYAEYRNEDYRQALVAPRHSRQITSLEARVSPDPCAGEMLDKIHSIDKAVLFFGTQDAQQREALSRWQRSMYTDNKARGQDFFYVLHFPKESDKPKRDPLKYRHFTYRRKMMRTALELAKALSNSAYLRERIRGIDTCANEIGCRPEVFADTFRFLRSFPVEYYRHAGSTKGMPRLSLTYHVGEDFLDLSDGLRAIDEAVIFLDMRRGDRLGHALALGVDPRLHYRNKGSIMVLPKQDLLDNLIWLRFRSRQLNVTLSGSIKDVLDEKAWELFNQIYAPYTKGLQVSLADYYHSMLLRSDRPDCYAETSFRPPQATLDPFDAYAVNDNKRIAQQLQQCRAQDVPVLLCHLYQYSKDVLRKGSVITKMHIEPEYISTMSSMQAAMQEFINDNGISIECNPSSNVLIGTFDDYANHPIFRFNGEGLHLPYASCQMHVSINSDDPGVFDTSLPFEYALLAGTLADMMDESGKRLHTDREIESYLRSLVRMGQEQCFPSVL